MSGLPRPLVGRGTPSSALGERAQGRRAVSPGNAAAPGSVEDFSSGCSDCLDYYRAVFDYNLLFNHDDISIC